LPALFLDITRHCLHRDPQRRWTVVEIAARLNPGSIAPSVSAAKPANAPSPVPAAALPPIIPSVPQAPAPVTSAAVKAESACPVPLPSPASKPQVYTQTVAVRGTAKRPRYELVQPQLKRPPLLPALPNFNYLPLAVVAALALTAVFLGPRLLHHRAPVEQSASVESSEPPAAKPVSVAAHNKNASKSAQKPAPPALTSASKSSQHAAQLPSQSSLEKTSDKHSVSSAAPAALTNVANPPRVDSAATPVTQGEVLSQVMPEVSPRARATIRGTVHVAVKLHVDTTGNVASAELFSPGPSRYFADQALQAAHRWDFAPAKVDGHAVASEWVVRFEFTPLNTKAHPTQSTP
jgi:TonB family protein